MLRLVDGYKSLLKKIFGSVLYFDNENKQITKHYDKRKFVYELRNHYTRYNKTSIRGKRKN